MDYKDFLDLSASPENTRKLKKIEEKGSDSLKQDLTDGKITIGEAYKKVTVHVGHNSGKYEWYTPKKFIDAARNVMGSIDLDPASSQIANKVIQATTIYTEQDSGLVHPWSGNIWMNPPYNNSLVGEFTRKLVEDLSNINQACVLVNNATETRWFKYISGKCDMMCQVTGRIKFLDENGEATGSSL
jgi:ParB family chromosome partitioning protein